MNVLGIKDHWFPYFYERVIDHLQRPSVQRGEPVAVNLEQWDLQDDVIKRLFDESFL